MSDAAGLGPDAVKFTQHTEHLRRELLAHCYRILGSLDEAEDLVQETYLRAWRSYGGFEGRSSVRSWLYRIATNACLSAIEKRERRPLPSGLGVPGADPTIPLEPAGPGISWLQPIPDHLVASQSNDPATIVVLRESLRLALIASLQYLPARQRAVLILRDVLDWPAAEVAEMLDTSTAAVKSMLQRARAQLRKTAPDGDQRVDEPTEPERLALLNQYIAAFENADGPALEAALRMDAKIEVTGFRTWFAGRVTCTAYVVGQVFHGPGEYRLLPTRANGQPAVVSYRRGPDGVHRAYGVAVVTTTSTGISAITVFADADLVTKFGFPPIAPRRTASGLAPALPATALPATALSASATA